ncbi:iron-containing alcohol dehydrogenase [Peptostreptococcaceae bacterium oral taxon 081]|nr:iron-containing alcohol dehydrogenase [Peptostreptococcaceae bacterium oral taxon 081]
MAIENFMYHNPVRILFGKDQISKISKYVPKDKKILIVYGGGSAKKFGTIDKVKKALEGYKIGEFSGIPANPTYEKSMEAVELIKKENYDFIMAVGGGSVVDAVKFICAAVLFEGDPKDLFFWGNNEPAEVKNALPFGVVLTLPATGSEMNDGAVITFVERQAKLSFGSPLVHPQFSVLDPELTYTLPKRQLANGVVDTYVHVMEQYLTYPVDARVQDYHAEGVLKTLIELGSDIVDENKHDYAVRANFMWAATNGLNRFLACGVPQDWATHILGHEITEKYGIDHGRTLAIVLPSLMNVMRNSKKDKILQYAKNIFNITQGSEDEKIDKAIQKTAEFFESLGVPTHFKDYEIGEEAVEILTNQLEKHGFTKLGEKGEVNLEKIKLIYKGAL